jgi:hypothetical protein
MVASSTIINGRSTTTVSNALLAKATHAPTIDNTRRGSRCTTAPTVMVVAASSASSPVAIKPAALSLYPRSRTRLPMSQGSVSSGSHPIPMAEANIGNNK